MSVEDLEVAQEMLKVHSFSPLVVNGTEVKMTLLKQHIGLSTPVQDSVLLVTSYRCFCQKENNRTNDSFLKMCFHRWLFTIFSWDQWILW